MKRSVFLSLTVCLSIFLISLSSKALFAQGPSGLGYRAFWPVLPEQSTGLFGVNDFTFKSNGAERVALVAGRYQRTDRPGDTGFVYDHFGLIDPDQPQKFWDLLDLVGGQLPEWVPAGYNKTRVYGVNSSGRICGVVWGESQATNQKAMGFYINLTDPLLEMKPLPAFYTTSTRSWGWKVNEFGEVLLIGNSGDNSREVEVSIYNPELDYLLHVRKNQNEPFFFYDYDRLGFNSNLDILGELIGDLFYDPTIKHQAREDATDENGIGLSFADGNRTTIYQDYFAPTSINEYSEFGCRARIKRRRGNKWDHYYARITADGLLGWSNLGEFPPWVDDINNSGDVFVNENPPAFYLHEGERDVIGDETFIEDFFQLVIPESDPNGVLQGNGPSNCILSDRDPTTGFGWIAGRQLLPDGSVTLVLLIPEVPGQSPGISVSPTSGLTTTEGGGTAEFSVVLDAEPSHPVTIDFYYDTTEGTTNVAFLEFDQNNWDTAQEVIVTGVDDTETDGDVTYTITAAASSTDGHYQGLTAEVTVTNLDDEVSNVTMSVDDPSVTEGNNGDQTAGQFTVTLSAAAASEVQVWYQVFNGSARKNKDYAMVDSSSDVLSFAAGETSQTVRFVILGDNRRESDETFSIELTNAFGATISKSVGTATIIDND